MLGMRRGDRDGSGRGSRRLVAGAAGRAEVSRIAGNPAGRQLRVVEVQAGRGVTAIAGDGEEPVALNVLRHGGFQFTGALREVSVVVDDLGGHGDTVLLAEHEAFTLAHGGILASLGTGGVSAFGYRYRLVSSVPGINILGS